MSALALIAWPYHAGLADVSMGLGATVLAADQRLRSMVLGGNCISCLGTTAGARDGRELGVVWLDAHADLDTPEDNLSGFTDVM